MINLYKKTKTFPCQEELKYWAEDSQD